jgi:restriction system protein
MPSAIPSQVVPVDPGDAAPAGAPAQRPKRRRRSKRRPPPARLKQLAVGLMGMAALLLLAGWVFPAVWRPALAEWRAPALALLGVGALLMWQQTRRVEGQLREEALSSLTHSSMMPYEFAPVTVPMEDPAEAAATETLGADASADASGDAPAADAAADATPADGAAGPAPMQWTPGLLRALEWRRFEALCEEIFKQDGYVTRTDPQAAEGGGYLWLHSRLDLQQPVRIVECHNWSGEPVGVAAVREFLGAMVDAGLKSGALMTCGTFTAEAEALARRHGIMAVSGPDLLALVAKRTEPLQRELLAVATLGDYRRPTCRRCGSKMLASAAATEGALTHWVCEGAPRCSGTLEWSAGPA